MIILGIEGGGTRTTALLVEGTDNVLASFAVGPGNLQLLSAEELAARLHAINDDTLGGGPGVVI
jgi:N-acetylglucosamine kinase-like BadF-type ATPase